jgi:hypothetical protein
MKTLAFWSLLLLSGLPVFGQSPADLFDKAPPAIDEALRAQVDKFYQSFIAGKFKQAYLLVADDSQDKFFELPKEQYKSCEIIKVNYTENFTKAAIVTSCKADWRFHGTVVLTTFPLTSNWEVIDGQWFWHYVRPTMVASPFSPTGFVPVPADGATNPAALVPKDIPGAAQAILAKVSIDKGAVRLQSYQASQDVVHVRNDMPGEVRLKLDQINLAGLKVSVGKTDLKAHEETTIVFEWRPDAGAKKVNANTIAKLHIDPTGQVFSINVGFDNTPPQK